MILDQIIFGLFQTPQKLEQKDQIEKKFVREKLRKSKVEVSASESSYFVGVRALVWVRVRVWASVCVREREKAKMRRDVRK